MVLKVIVKETGEILVGSVVGLPVTDAITGAIAGKMGYTGWKKFGTAAAVKTVFSLGMLGLGEMTNNADLQNFLVGMAVAPIASLPNDAVKAQYGTDIQDMVYAKAAGAGVRGSAARAARAAMHAGQMGPGTAPVLSQGQLMQLERQIQFRGAR